MCVALHSSGHKSIVWKHVVFAARFKFCRVAHSRIVRVISYLRVISARLTRIASIAIEIIIGFFAEKGRRCCGEAGSLCVGMHVDILVGIAIHVGSVLRSTFRKDTKVRPVRRHRR